MADVRPNAAATAAAAQAEEGILKKFFRKMTDSATTGGSQAIVEIFVTEMKNRFKVARRRLFRDLDELEWENGTFTTKNTEQIRERLRKAKKGFTEHNLVFLLCLATDDLEDKPDKRRDILKHLNSLSDKDFEDRMYTLDNDVAQQVVKWFWDNAKATGGFIQEKWEKHMPNLMKATRDRIVAGGHRIADQAARINEAAERQASQINNAADRLDGKLGPGLFSKWLK